MPKPKLFLEIGLPSPGLSRDWREGWPCQFLEELQPSVCLCSSLTIASAVDVHPGQGTWVRGLPVKGLGQVTDLLNLVCQANPSFSVFGELLVWYFIIFPLSDISSTSLYLPGHLKMGRKPKIGRRFQKHFPFPKYWSAVHCIICHMTHAVL